MADKKNSRELFVGDLRKKIQQTVSVNIVQSLSWFIKDEQLWALIQRAAYENKPLFGKAQSPERGVGFFF